MAKVTNPLNSTEARGAIGGLVYGTWRGISYVRTRVTPANQSTPRRLALRALSAACTHRWQLISDAQRTAWQQFANTHTRPDWTGTPRRPHGFNWFLKCNVLRLDMGYAIVDDPPYIPNATPLQSLAAAPDADHLDLSWTLPAGAVAADLQADIWLTQPLSSGRFPKIQDAKHYAYAPSEDLAYATADLYTGTYGAFIRTIREDSGLASPFLLAIAAIGAAGVLTQGPLYPSLGEHVPGADTNWVNPTRIYFADSLSASATLPPGEFSDILNASLFHFAIPGAATILGLVVDVLAQQDTQSQLYAQLSTLAVPFGDQLDISVTNTSFEWITLGGDDNLWGFALTPAIINAPYFGVGLKAAETAYDYSEFLIDTVRITVFYST